MAKTKDGAKAGSGVPFINSIKFKIIALTLAAVIAAVAAMLAIIIPAVQKDMKETING